MSAVRSGQRGFTVIELLLATVVFSVILIVITTGVLSFTRQYYSGLVATNTQSVTRQIMDDVIRTIQFNPGKVYPLGGVNVRGYCIGESVRYSFTRNAQVTESGAVAANHQYAHGLIKDKLTGCNTSTLPLTPSTQPAVLPDGMREVLGEHMRLVKFTISPAPTSGSYVVTVRVAYGDDDLLCSPSIASGQGSCNYYGNGPFNAMVTHDNLKCKTTTGSQFCAVSELTTVVSKRVE